MLLRRPRWRRSPSRSARWRSTPPRAERGRIPSSSPAFARSPQGPGEQARILQVIESIVAEDIGKLPDNNVIEALQRVTGVQVTNRGGGEADAISIRGLPDITTTWNGRNVFTGVGRALALQDIPANLIGRVDVFKTRAADQLETGLAGQIDVRTRRPFDLPVSKCRSGARHAAGAARRSLDPNASFLVEQQLGSVTTAASARCST